MEPHYSVADVKRLFFPSRSDRWIKDRAKRGAFGTVLRDAGGWMIPESGLRAYLDNHAVEVGPRLLKAS